jgi:hypothetical protein
MKNKSKMLTVGIVPKSTGKHVERGKIDTLSTFLLISRQIRDEISFGLNFHLSLGNLRGKNYYRVSQV